MDKAYIVTGASGGIGKLVVAECRKQGADVLEVVRSAPVVRPYAPKFFKGDLAKEDVLQAFLERMTDYVTKMKAQGVRYFGLFNSIGIPARVPPDASDDTKARVMAVSMLVNYEIPRRIAAHFATLVDDGSVVFVSTQYTLTEPDAKRTYFIPKQKLERAAADLARKYPKLKFNTILPGNLGIGMSGPAREKYVDEGSLVDADVLVEQCMHYLTQPTETNQRILVVGREGKTFVEKQPEL